MKVTDVQCSLLVVPRGARTPEEPERTWKEFLVKVFTDEGITGIGIQRAAQGGKFWGEYIEGYVKKFLINEVVEPFYIEKFVRNFRSQNFSTFISPRPSCVEIALWDAVGKKAGLPVYKLLGAYQDKVKAYATIGQDPRLLKAEFTDRLIEEGFKGVKIGSRAQPQEVIDIVKTVRDNMGYGIDIMVDLEQAWSPHPVYNFRKALKLAKGLEKYDVAWLEEPLPHINNPELSAQLCRAVDIQIAGGGQIFGLPFYKCLLEKGSLDIVQPDVVFAGGILEVRRIATVAEMYGKLCIPHYAGPGLGLAALLQLIGSTNIPWLEFCNAVNVEERDSILKENIKIDKDGYVNIPDGPGLGVELNEEAVENYTVAMEDIDVITRHT